MHKAKWLLPLALLVPLLMAPSGGYPSFPTFQGVTVNGADNLSITTFNDNATPVSGIYTGWANNGTLIGAIGTGGVLGGFCPLNDFCITSQKAGAALDIITSGGGAVKINGATFAQTAVINATQVTSSACTVVTSRGIGTCTTNGAGTTTTITFSPAFTTAPVCTVSDSSTLSTIIISAAGLTASQVVLISAAVSQQFYLICSS